MQNQMTYERRNRRYSVADIGYQATIVVGKESFEFKVLDFSANGIQLEMPLETGIPSEGNLRFREQSFRYVVRQVRSDDKTKRLGIEMSAISPEELAPLQSKTIPGLHMSSCENGKEVLSRTVGNFVFYCIAFIGITFASVLLLGQSESPYRSHLEKLMGSVSCLLTQDNSGIAIAGDSPKTGGQVIQVASDAVSRAQSFLKSDNYSEVIKAADEAIFANVSNVDAWRLRGIALGKLAQYDGAIEALRRALSLNSNDPNIHEELSQAFNDSGQYTAAVKQIQRGFELAEGETKLRLKQSVAKAYDARAMNRLENNDKEGAKFDRIEASRWRQ